MALSSTKKTSSKIRTLNINHLSNSNVILYLTQLNMSMKDSGKITKEMERENNSGKMVACMRATGKIILLTDSEDSSIQTAMSTSGNGLTIKPTVKELIFHNVAPSTKVTG